jgi:hypothetical protein
LPTSVSVLFPYYVFKVVLWLSCQKCDKPG